MTSGDSERERLTALGGLAALSLDALSSVAYGPEAILVVLVAAGTAGLRFSLPVTGAIVVLLAALIISYRQVIEAFPNGGGAYAVSQRHLGRVPSLVAAASLIIDYVPVFAVGVFVGFTLSQVGMVRHWYATRGPGFRRKALINGIGAVLTLAATGIELISKFLEGAWLVALLIPLLTLLFRSISRTYDRIGAELEIGQVPPPPVKLASLVVVPVAGMSRLTAEGISTALSIGDDVIAVTVLYTDEADDPDDVPDVPFRAEWEAWRPEVPLLTLRSGHRSLAKPIVSYLRSVEAEDRYHRLVVLIPEVEPSRPWGGCCTTSAASSWTGPSAGARAMWCCAGCATGSGRSPRRRRGSATAEPTPEPAQGTTPKPIPKQKLTGRFSRVASPSFDGNISGMSLHARVGR